MNSANRLDFHDSNPFNLETGEKKIHFLSNKYAIKIFSISGRIHEFTDGDTYVLELGNLATESIENEIGKTIVISKNNNIKLVKNFPNNITCEDNLESEEATFCEYEKILNELSEQGKKANKSVILGFSSLGGYSLLSKISKIIKILKKENPNIIFVIGGADFNALPDKDFLKMIFDYGFDSINIGGAQEFTNFIGNINDVNKFYRDESGILHITNEDNIPKNLLFHYNLDSTTDIEPGKKIDTTYYYDEIQNILHYTINGNPCLNNCWYCSIDNNKQTNNYDEIKAANELNSYIGEIEIPEDENTFNLSIENPNPFQNIEKFGIFLNNLNLEKVAFISFFCDFLGLGNNKVYEKFTKIIDDLLIKWPNLNIGLSFSFDAIHEKEDGDFIGRTHGKKIAKEKRYTAGFKNFDKFHEKYKDNIRVKYGSNIIFHPNMEASDYVERFNLIKHYNLPSKTKCFALVPEQNTKISKDHKGYFIPEYMIDSLKNSLGVKSDFSYWGINYLNSEFLDVYSITNHLGYSHHVFELFNKHENQDDNQIDDGNNKGDYPLISFLKIFLKINKTNVTNKGIKTNKDKNNFEELIDDIDFCIKYIDLMLYRENYICSINPTYNDEFLNENLQELKEMQNKYKLYLLELKEIIKSSSNLPQ